ncbi:hypothetical protein Rsub_08765 [Raphidocelis subcapitata]|uniref:Uncharacterized protein n=1 Tax=Raphidocelis subcapitata TaxID=307507 RepID=A0A2V0PE97_9CHLO|nr:hypothetical protein Rsub_08765 [Raphidocelis subcapitata]|eukprot:GBF96220.1 hypothetical protein Rsub_08765 [Raphidocelis subcapitata]
MDQRQSARDAEGLDQMLLENYALISASHEQQNIGRLADALVYQRRLHANLQSIVSAVAASDAPVGLDPDSSADARDATMAARDAQRLASAAAPDAPRVPTAPPLPAPPPQALPGAGQWLQPPLAAAPPPLLPPPQHQQQPPPQQPLPPQQPQHQQQQQQPPIAPAWLAGVNMSVSGLLSTLGLPEYQPLFEEHRIDMAALELLSRDDLRGLGLPLGAVVKIEAALREQRRARGGGGGGGGGG